MQFAILIYSSEEAMLKADPASKQAMLAAYQSYTQALQSAGILLGWNRLRPTASATTVRIADGKTQVLNGPFADTREQLGGFYLIDVADLDTAINWGARCPSAAVGTIEVRPVWDPKDY
ncbi:YciI family protein [Labrys sp. KNU-23]|uniref:YciI family protein n=1 Tax=Labrys sp. KNU-23 TaxID=2789216 RepID=UPI0011EE15C3|nr:YciI family protein [Labrys sp. KNU-23]QEN89498.1 YciI family protein [Labrys sp. KNU-23]